MSSDPLTNFPIGHSPASQFSDLNYQIGCSVGVKHQHRQAIYEYLNTVYSRNIYLPETQTEMREHLEEIIKKNKVKGKLPSSFATRQLRRPGARQMEMSMSPVTTGRGQ